MNIKKALKLLGDNFRFIVVLACIVATLYFSPNVAVNFAVDAARMLLVAGVTLLGFLVFVAIYNFSALSSYVSSVFEKIGNKVKSWWSQKNKPKASGVPESQPAASQEKNNNKNTTASQPHDYLANDNSNPAALNGYDEDDSDSDSDSDNGNDGDSDDDDSVLYAGASFLKAKI